MFILTVEQHRLVVRTAAAQNYTNGCLLSIYTVSIFTLSIEFPGMPGSYEMTVTLTLALLVFRIFTDYSDASFSSNNLAFFANRFYR